MLLDFKVSKSGQILCVHKTGFLSPDYIYVVATYTGI